MSTSKRKTLSEEQLKAYQEGKLSGSKAYEVERQAFDSDFASEAQEGLSAVQPFEWTKDLSELRLKLKIKKKPIPYFQIAAVIAVLLVGSVTLWLSKNDKNESLAFQSTPPEKENNPEELVTPLPAIPDQAQIKDPDPISTEDVINPPAIKTKEKAPIDVQTVEPIDKIEPIVSTEGEVKNEFPIEPIAFSSESLALEETSDLIAAEQIQPFAEPKTQAAPVASIPSASQKMITPEKSVESRLKATGAVSRSASTPTSIEILACSPSENEKNQTFLCAKPEYLESIQDYLDEKEIVGSLMLELLVDETGTVQTVTTLNTSNSELETETIRFLKEKVKWNPAQLNGDFVLSKVTLGIIISE